MDGELWKKEVTGMKRMWVLFLALLLCFPACSETAGSGEWAEEDPWEDEPISEELLEEFNQYYAPFCKVEDGVLYIKEGVTRLGWNPYPDEDDAEDSLCFGGDLFYDTLAFEEVRLPSTLRVLDTECFLSLHFTRFTIPAGLERLSADAFVYCAFDELNLETVLPFDQVRGALDDCPVAAWAAPEGHPLYSVRDGVLFSADGKTLLSYPSARQNAHYDVPRGVTDIAPYAFQNEYLQTISLPIGLQRIGDYGFAECTRLQALALPLTVKELGRDPFYACVSLDLLSLPEGLTANRREYWADYYRDGLFHGDNGSTLTEPLKEDDE